MFRLKHPLILISLVLNSIYGWGQGSDGSASPATQETQEVHGDTVFVRYNRTGGAPLTYATDTFISPGFLRTSFLVGTTALPSTRNQLDARRWDVCLNSVSSKECSDIKEGRGASYIKSVDRLGSELKITVQAYANCCYNFLGDVGVSNDSTLNMIYHPYGNSHCACDCLHELTYFLTLDCLVDENRSNGLKRVVLNGREGTLKPVPSGNP